MNRVCQTAFRRKHNRPRRGLSRPPAELVVEPMAVISNRRFYRWASDFGEYLEGMADKEKQAEVKSVSDLLDEIENETLYLALITVDKRTLQIVLLKMQGYSTKEIAASVKLSTKSVYRRMERLRIRLKPFKS